MRYLKETTPEVREKLKAESRNRQEKKSRLKYLQKSVVNLTEKAYRYRKEIDSLTEELGSD